jgi:hypothetical protein
MPLIKPRTHRVRTLRHICRLQEPNREVLLAYATFIGESADYVLNQLIDTTLARDRDFVSWRAGREPNVSSQVAPAPSSPIASAADTQRSRS